MHARRTLPLSTMLAHVNFALPFLDGYTRTGWNEDPMIYGHSADKDAFVFQIRSSEGYKQFISNVKKNEKYDFNVRKALGYGHQCFGQFGNTWIFRMRFTKDGCETIHNNPDNYEPFEHDETLLGWKRTGKVSEIEAFQMI